MSPKELGAECRRVLAAREVRAQIERLKAAGAKVIYASADIRDGRSLAEAIRRAAAEHGPVRGIVHGAGVIADKLILEKTPEQFSSVFDTKVGGLRRLLEAVDLGELRFAVLFSSTTARFGRKGQSDYAMANEALNKAAVSLSRRLPDCRVVSIGWGPWDGGMVNASLKRLFESEGVPVIGLEAGAKAFLAELCAAEAEVVIMGSAAAPEAPNAERLRTVFRREISVDSHPFLGSHVINGKAVLPFAVIAEWLGHAALHDNPGLLFHGFDGMRIFKGVLVDGSPVAVEAASGKARRDAQAYSVAAELRAGSLLHSGAKVILAGRLPSGTPRLAAPSAAYPHDISKIYKRFLFHGPEMRAIRAVTGISEDGIAVESHAALPPQSWYRNPPRDQWLMDPLALDAAFQAMILWSFERLGAGSLPSHISSYRQFRSRFPQEGVRIVAKVARCLEGLAVADIEFVDFQGSLVARIEGYECTVDSSLNDAFRRNTLAEAQGSGEASLR